MTDPTDLTLFEGDNLPQIVAERDTARARKTDPLTSHAAADSNQNREEVAEHVLHLLQRFGPMTDSELTVRFFVDTTSPEAHFDSPRKRRSDLTKAGLVIPTITRRPTTTGRASIVWTLAK
jgi:hypothetical protein